MLKCYEMPKTLFQDYKETISVEPHVLMCIVNVSPPMAMSLSPDGSHREWYSVYPHPQSNLVTHFLTVGMEFFFFTRALKAQQHTFLPGFKDEIQLCKCPSAAPGMLCPAVST